LSINFSYDGDVIGSFIRDSVIDHDHYLTSGEAHQIYSFCFRLSAGSSAPPANASNVNAATGYQQSSVAYNIAVGYVENPSGRASYETRPACFSALFCISY